MEWKTNDGTPPTMDLSNNVGNRTPPTSDDDLPAIPRVLHRAEDPDENVDWTFKLCFDFIEIGCILPLLYEWYDKNKDVVMDENFLASLNDEFSPPTYYEHKPGAYYQVRWTSLNFTADLFQPWSNTPPTGSTVPKIQPSNYKGGRVVSKGGPVMRYHMIRGSNPRNPDLKKMTVRFQGGGIFDKFAFVMYIFSKANMVLPKRIKRRLDSNLSKKVQVAVHNRDLEHAIGTLDPHVRSEVSTKQIQNRARYDDTYVKSKRGRIPVTCSLRLTAMSIQYSLFGCKQWSSISNPSNKPFQEPDIWHEAWWVDEEAVRVFAKDLPDITTLKRHQKEIYDLLKKSSAQQGQYIEDLLDNVTPSVTIPDVCGLIMADTTFDLADMYLTVVLGLLHQFRTQSSKKCRSIMLGFVMHPKREMHYHEEFGRSLSAAFAHIAPTKRVSAYMTDGESALRTLFKGDAFSMAVPLRCDVHRISNFDKRLSDLPQEDLHWIKEEIFGERRFFSTGEEVYVGGALSLLQQQDCVYCIGEIRAKYPEYDEVQKLLTDEYAEHLHRHNSLFAKLMAGIVAQYASTNVIEGFNSKLRHLFPRAEGGHKVSERLIRLNKADINVLFDASLKRSDVVIVAPKLSTKCRTLDTWHRMPETVKRDFIESWGLPLKLVYRDYNVPNWVVRTTSNISKILNNLEYHQLPGTQRYYVYNKTEFLKGTGCEEITSNRIKCGDKYCNEIYDIKLQPCRHIILILAKKHPDISRRYWNLYEQHYNKQTADQIIRRQRAKGAGKKLKPRKGHETSKKNGPRTYHETGTTNFTQKCMQKKLEEEAALQQQAEENEEDEEGEHDEDEENNYSNAEHDEDDGNNYSNDEHDEDDGQDELNPSDDVDRNNNNDSVQWMHEQSLRRRRHAGEQDDDSPDKRMRQETVGLDVSLSVAVDSRETLQDTRNRAIEDASNDIKSPVKKKKKTASRKEVLRPDYNDLEETMLNPYMRKLLAPPPPKVSNKASNTRVKQAPNTLTSSKKEPPPVQKKPAKSSASQAPNTLTSSKKEPPPVEKKPIKSSASSNSSTTTSTLKTSKPPPLTYNQQRDWPLKKDCKERDIFSDSDDDERCRERFHADPSACRIAESELSMSEEPVQEKKPSQTSNASNTNSKQPREDGGASKDSTVNLSDDNPVIPRYRPKLPSYLLQPRDVGGASKDSTVNLSDDKPVIPRGRPKLPSFLLKMAKSPLDRCRDDSSNLRNSLSPTPSDRRSARSNRSIMTPNRFSPSPTGRDKYAHNYAHN